MSDIELNGYDETGNIGENLIFVKSCINEINILRPYIYNLLHFNSLTVTKSILKSQPGQLKKNYFRNILDDTAIQSEFYRLKPDDQLYLIRKFIALEFNYLYRERHNLVDGLIKHQNKKDKEGNELYNKSSKVAEYLSRYRKSDKYIEQLVKSYGHKLVIRDLEKTSKMLTCKPKKNIKSISLVDGGFPLVFWYYSFLNELKDDKSPFSFSKTPIYGIAKGDEYFPVIQIAGNLAYISSSLSLYPQNINQLFIENNAEIIKYIKEFRTNYYKRKSHKKIIFTGYIPTELQYTLPFMLHRECREKDFYEGFRVKNSIKDFSKEFGFNPENDFVLRGKIPKGSSYEKIIKEAENLNIKIMRPEDFFDSFQKLINDVSSEGRLSNLSTEQYSKIEWKLNKIKKSVKKQIK